MIRFFRIDKTKTIGPAETQLSRLTPERRKGIINISLHPVFLIETGKMQFCSIETEQTVIRPHPKIILIIRTNTENRKGSQCKDLIKPLCLSGARIVTYQSVSDSSDPKIITPIYTDGLGVKMGNTIERYRNNRIIFCIQRIQFAVRNNPESVTTTPANIENECVVITLVRKMAMRETFVGK